MKMLCAAAGAALLACYPSAFADTTVGCGKAITLPLHARSILRIESRPVGIEIVGTDADTLHVTCTSEDPERARDISMRVAESPGNDKLEITGDYDSHNSSLKIRVEVPHRTSVVLRMSAGQVDASDLKGNMDVELTAGQITMRGINGRDYRKVDASVDIGQVSAPAWGADKGGFFRSFTKNMLDGEFVLHAHVMTGQIELEGSAGTAE
jgi:hypothetical protein